MKTVLGLLFYVFLVQAGWVLPVKENVYTEVSPLTSFQHIIWL